MKIHILCLLPIALIIWIVHTVVTSPFILGYCIELHIHVVLLASKFTLLITKALFPIKLWVKRQCLSMQHFTGICVCTNRQLTHRHTSMQNLLSPLGDVTFLLFSRFSQSSALPSLSAIKRGEVFQDLATWSKAIRLINCISIQLRCLCTQIHRSIHTITSILVPQV